MTILTSPFVFTYQTGYGLTSLFFSNFRWRALPINGFIIHTRNTHECPHPQVYPDTFCTSGTSHHVLVKPNICNPYAASLWVLTYCAKSQNTVLSSWNVERSHILFLFYSSPSNLWFMWFISSVYQWFMSALWKHYFQPVKELGPSTALLCRKLIESH